MYVNRIQKYSSIF